MRALAKVAEAANVILLHGNEQEIYGDIPHRCLDIVTSVDWPNLRLAWDPANFVQVGVGPGQLRSGWHATAHRGLQPASAVRRVAAGQGCAARRRLGRSGWRG
jgi:hypothetical protein